MNLLQAIILGLIQGVTEWLPISSSGHLVIVQELTQVNQPVFFELILHLASLLVIIVAFRRRIVSLIRGVLQGNRNSLYFFYKLFVASVPIVFVGLAFDDAIKSAFKSTSTVAAGLIITSVFLFSTKIKPKRKKLTAIRASIVGVSQALAILPGVSRSGSTISTGLLLGIRREDAAFFSFMLFIPAIIGTSILKIPEVSGLSGWPAIIIGFIVTFVSGYVSLKWLLKTIKNEKFHFFGFYCLGLACLVLVFL